MVTGMTVTVWTYKTFLNLLSVNDILSNHVVCFFTKNKHDQRDGVFKNIAWTWLSLWVIEHHHVLAYLKHWSYNKTQLSNDQIRSTWCIASRGNVSKAGILMVFETIWNCRKKHENNVSKACIVTAFQTIWNCREKKKTWTVDGEFWRVLKRFGTAEKKWKQCL